MATEIRLKLKLRYATVQLPANLADLDDVLLTAIQDGQILMYDDGSETWYNVTPATYGDMLKSVYDPNTVEGDAFDMDNMVEGATKLILSVAERASIASAEQSANKGSANGYAPLDGSSKVPVANIPDLSYLPLSLVYNDQRTLGAYSLVAADAGKMVLTDDAITIPSGLGAGFQCAIAQSNVAKQTLTINAAYTTVIGAPEANISPDGILTIGVVDGTTIIIQGATEA